MAGGRVVKKEGSGHLRQGTRIVDVTMTVEVESVTMDDGTPEMLVLIVIGQIDVVA